MPDLVNDPRFFGIDQPEGENPLHDDDPTNDYMFDEWKRKADLWREWSGLQDQKIADAVQEGATRGQTGDQTLQALGFKNAKEQGQHAFTMYGNNGFYSQQGAAIDPGWVYDWASGRKYNKGTADKSANGTTGTRWEPINAEEKASHAQAQKYTAQGLTDYGSQANYNAFQKAAKNGHFTQDPKSGNYFNIGSGDPNDPKTWQWKDQYGRDTKGGVPKNVDLASVGNYASDQGMTGSGGAGGSASGYGDGGFDYGVGNFGLDRSMQSYMDQRGKQNYLTDLAGATLGVQFDGQGNYYKRPTANDVPSRVSTADLEGQGIDWKSKYTPPPAGASSPVPGAPPVDDPNAPPPTRHPPIDPNAPGASTPPEVQYPSDFSMEDAQKMGYQGPDLGLQQESAQSMMLAPQLEQLGKMQQEAIDRARREGRERDIPSIIQDSEGQKLQMIQGLQQQSLQYLNSPDQYKDLPGYMGELGAQTQLQLGQMSSDTQRYLGDQNYQLGISGQDLQRYLGDQANSLGMSQLDLQKELGLGDLDLRKAGLDQNFNLAQMGDATTRRGQDMQKELAMLGYAQQDKANNQQFYSGLGQAGINLLGSGLSTGGWLRGGTTAAGALSGVGGLAGGGLAAGGPLAAGALVGAGTGYLTAKLTGGNRLGGTLGGIMGGPLNALVGSHLGGIKNVVGGAVKGIGKLFSDMEVKEQVFKDVPGLAELEMIDPLSYFYKSEEFGPTTERSFGVSAQDLEKILPEAVSIDPETGFRQVDYQKILMTNVNATKELAEKLDSLEKGLASTYRRKKGKK